MSFQNIQPVVQRFILNKDTVNELKKLKPEFGFNGLGELVFRRTYSRDNEDWADVVKRVVEGCMSIRKDHFIKNSLYWNDNDWQNFANDMAKSMFSMEFLPPGRGLWMMGTEFTYNNGSMSLNNCAATDTKEDLVLSAEWTMDALMNGVGVGFTTNWRGNGTKPDKNDTEIFIIPDSREGWVESLIKLMCSYIDSPRYGKNKYPTFDYSKIRQKGLPIKGFGGTASGYEPLKHMHDRVESYLDAFCDGRLKCKTTTWKDVGNSEWREVEINVDKPYSHTRLIADIFNAIGACVVAGNVRRCKPKDTLVMLDRGLVKIQHVKKDDKVLTSQGYSNVMENIYQGKQQILNINTDIGISCCTSNHKMAVMVTENDYVWKKAKDLTNNDYLLFNTSCIEGIETCLPQIVSDKLIIPELNQDISWFLGYFYICGKFSNNSKINIIFNNEKVKEKLENCLKRFGGVFEYKNNNTIVSKNKELSSYLCLLNIINNVPKFILQGTSDIRASYLAGVNDGTNTETILATSIARSFLNSIQSMYASLGIPVCNKFNKIYFYKNYGINKWEKMVGIYALFSHNINNEESDYSCYTNWIPIKVYGIKMDRLKTQTYDLSVENNHEYFCGEGLLNHNSAEICLGDANDEDFVNLKNFFINPERGSIGWMSNNSVVLKSDGNYEDFSYIPEMAKGIRDNGEPGMINLYNIQKYGRFGKELNDDATLVNPCGEIPLENFELCNLSEVFPPRCKNKERFFEALKFATFYSSTVSLLPTSRPETNAVIARNRRIGVSISGIIQWASGIVSKEWGQMNYTNVCTFLRDGYKVVRDTNSELAKKAGIPKSIRVTTVKPSGSISLLAGATPGVHYPISRYAIRRIRIGENSPLIEPLIKAGVRYEKDQVSSNTLVFEFIIDHGDVRPCEQVSPWEQFSLVQMIQKHYADNCVSATIYFDKEKDGQDIEKMLAMYIPNLKSISMLPHAGHGYVQAPYEPITKQQYEERKSEFEYPKYDNVKNNVPVGSKFCSGDKCEL